MKILNVNARFPGSTHDSHIWNGSLMVAILKYINAYEPHSWLLGDSGYALKPYMMVPFRRPQTEVQHCFNTLHAKIRSLIERVFGLLKSRFRCLSKDSGHLHYGHERSAYIIHSCMVIHNFLIENSFPIENIDITADEMVPVPEITEQENILGERNREYLANFFA